jgi:hypothetical protein
MRAHKDWAWYALLKSLTYIKTNNPDRDLVLLVVFMRVVACVLPDGDNIMYGVPSHLPPGFPPTLVRSLDEILRDLHDEDSRRRRFFENEHDAWKAHKLALIFIQQKLLGHCSNMPDLQVSIEEAQEGLEMIVTSTAGTDDGFDQFVGHLLAWKRKEALAFLANKGTCGWPHSTETTVGVVTPMIDKAEAFAFA